jgi:Xaa-Pro aminopeptidase
MKVPELQERMQDQGIDHCVFFNLDKDKNFFYLVQRDVAGAVLISSKDSRLVVSKLDSPDTPFNGTVVQWKKGRLLDSLKGYMRAPRRVGIDKDSMTVKTFQSVRKRMKGCSLVNVSGLLSELRATKTEEEIQKVKRACRVSQQILDKCQDHWKSFRTELEVSRFLKTEALSKDCDVAFEPIVASGPNASVPHHVPTSAPLRRGFCIIDYGVRCQGYCADLSRTFYLGSPTGRERALFNRVQEAQQTLVDCVLPGVSASLVYTKSTKLLGKLLTHNPGHGVGLDVHESPLLGHDSKDILREGMVISLEPAAYLPRKSGIRIEDMMIVKKKGAQLISRPQEFVRL